MHNSALNRREWLAQTGRLAVVGASVGSVMLSTPLVHAGSLAVPKGKVVLSISGAITQPNVEGRLDFDMDMLAAMPQHSFTTVTPWHDGPKKFTGPLLRDLLSAAGATGAALKAVALNDYKVEIPRDDATKFDMIMARLLDDQPMPVRAKGPLFIVYPYDSKAELRSERYYNRSAWQLRALEVL